MCLCPTNVEHYKILSTTPHNHWNLQENNTLVFLSSLFCIITCVLREWMVNYNYAEETRLIKCVMFVLPNGWT